MKNSQFLVQKFLITTYKANNNVSPRRSLNETKLEIEL